MFQKLKKHLALAGLLAAASAATLPPVASAMPLSPAYDAAKTWDISAHSRNARPGDIVTLDTAMRAYPGYNVCTRDGQGYAVTIVMEVGKQDLKNKIANDMASIDTGHVPVDQSGGGQDKKLQIETIMQQSLSDLFKAVQAENHPAARDAARLSEDRRGLVDIETFKSRLQEQMGLFADQIANQTGARVFMGAEAKKIGLCL